VVLAISDHPTTLHQFQGGKEVMGTVKSCFNEYRSNPGLIKEHTIRIDASSGESLLRKDNAASNSFSVNDDMSSVRSSVRDDALDETMSYNQLRIFLTTPKNDSDEGSAGGFGWMNEFGFYYASFN